jgi:hypothetical protein
MVRGAVLRVAGVVSVTGVAALLGASDALSKEVLPAPDHPRVAAASTRAMTWVELQDFRRVRAAQAGPEDDTFSAPGPRAALLQRVRAQVPRIGPAPSESAVTARDGVLTVQQGATARSFDPVTGAASTQRLPSGAGMPTWGPAGDRLLTVLGTTDRDVVLTDEDGSTNRVDLGSDGSVPRPRVPLRRRPRGPSTGTARSGPWDAARRGSPRRAGTGRTRGRGWPS